MAHTNAWDETRPAGSDLAAQIDDFMREMKIDVRERLALEHYWASDTAVGDDQDGVHKEISITPTTAGSSLIRTRQNQSLTGSQATPAVDLGVTWNTTGAPTALRLQVTDTASDASALLLDLFVDGSSKFSVDKAGNGVFSGTVTAATFVGALQGSGAAITNIPETAIVDGSILARVAAAETISSSWTFTAAPIVSMPNAQLHIRHTGAAANEGNWMLSVGPTTWSLSTILDNLTVGSTAIRVTRNGSSPTLIDLLAATHISSTLDVDSNLNVDGDAQIDGNLNVGGSATFLGTTNGGVFRLTEVLTGSPGATEHNYAPTGYQTAFFWSLSGLSGGSTITGIAGGVHGRIIVIQNLGGNITLSGNNPGSSIQNRFASTLVLTESQTAILYYNGVHSWWTFLSRYG